MKSSPALFDSGFNRFLGRTMKNHATSICRKFYARCSSIIALMPEIDENFTFFYFDFIQQRAGTLESRQSRMSRR